jgi:4-hydroxy-4-methyl-2-oxoglutarate aldolase
MSDPRASTQPAAPYGPELLALGAATVGESGGRPMRARIRAVWPGARLAAPAFPVHCTPGDNLAIHVAAAGAPAGSALVVDVGDEDELGYWGEVLTTAAQSRGIAGLVIDGGVRDTGALEAHGFPVFATTVALRGASKSRPGTVGAPVEVGGVSVAAGDWIVGDGDGVAVVTAGAIDDVVRAGRARADKEEAMFAALRQGATTLELLGLDASPVQGA